eukprot:SAG31_NODE_834_length_11650_cov_7.572245_4_plen_550_part_00
MFAECSKSYFDYPCIDAVRALIFMCWCCTMLSDTNRVAIYCAVTLQMSRLLGEQLSPQLRTCCALVESWLNGLIMSISPLTVSLNGEISNQARLIDIVCHLASRIRVRNKNGGRTDAEFLPLCDEAAAIMSTGDWCSTAKLWLLALQAYGNGASGQHAKANQLYQQVIGTIKKGSVCLFFPASLHILYGGMLYLREQQEARLFNSLRELLQSIEDCVPLCKSLLGVLAGFERTTAGASATTQVRTLPAGTSSGVVRQDDRGQTVRQVPVALKSVNIYSQSQLSAPPNAVYSVEQTVQHIPGGSSKDHRPLQQLQQQPLKNSSVAQRMQTPYVSVPQQERSWMQLSDTLHVPIQPSHQTQKQPQRRRSKATAPAQLQLNQMQMHQQMTQTGVGPHQVGTRIAVHHQQQQQQPSMHAQQQQCQQQQQSQPQSQRRRQQKSSSHQQPKRQRRQPPSQAEQLPKKGHQQVYLEAAKQLQDRCDSSNRGGVDVGGQGSSEEHMLGPRQGSLDMLRDIAAAQNQQDSSITIESLRRDNHYALGSEPLCLTILSSS